MRSLDYISLDELDKAAAEVRADRDCPYVVIVWNNVGERVEYPARDLGGALAVAKEQRTKLNRTVKVGHGGDSIRHWSRTVGAKRNHWATHSTAECSR